MVLFLFNTVVYIFLLISLCVLIVCLLIATLTEGFPCFFLSCKANFCVVLCIVCFVSFSVLFVCVCVLYYCHRVATQLQLTNISHIISTLDGYEWSDSFSGQITQGQKDPHFFLSITYFDTFPVNIIFNDTL
jgi:hypothetical protein